MAPPLEGLRVLSATRGIPGALISMVLADYGADVVKVEPPNGDAVRRFPSFHVWGRGQRSVVVDPASEQSVAALEPLLAAADVVLDGLPQPDSDALGLGGDVGAVYPRLIHCRLAPGDGDDEDLLVAARHGLMAPLAADDPPRHPGWQVVAHGTAAAALIAILTALLWREKSGRGQLLDVPTRIGVLHSTSMVAFWSAQPSGGVVSGAAGGAPVRRLLTGMYECADGEYLQIHTGAPGAFWRAMQIFGLDDRMAPSSSPHEMGIPLDPEEADLIAREVPLAFLSRPRDEWPPIFWAADVCCQPVLHPGEAFGDPQVLHNGLIVDVEDPELGRLRQVGPAVKFSLTPGRVRSPAPTVGEHGDALTNGWSATAGGPASRGVVSGESPLEGLRVLDFGAYFAGPFASRMMADYGADVIKVESLAGDAMRPLLNVFENAQRGKRSLSVDLKSPEGLALVHELLATTDVVTHNFRPGAAERLGIGYEDVKAINPGIVYCASPGFGSTGPKSQQQSFQPVCGGLSGLYYQANGEGNPPRQAGNEDYVNAVLAAQAILMALRHRARTGEGQYLESPQINSVMFSCSEVALGSDGNPVSGFWLDPDQLGWNALHRAYPTEAGWLAVVADSDESFTELAKALEIPGLVEDPRFASGHERLVNDDLLREAIGAALASAPATVWRSRLSAAGVPAEIVRETPMLEDFFTDEANGAAGLWVELTHPSAGKVRELANLVQLPDAPSRVSTCAPSLGQHTADILRELGRSDEEIEDLAGRDVVNIG